MLLLLLKLNFEKIRLKLPYSINPNHNEIRDEMEKLDFNLWLSV